jgi:hypothetical protein
MVAGLAVSVFIFGVHASAFHVHAYLDHDHVDHLHGPALHEHDPAVDETEDGPHVSVCDPAAHVVRISYTATAGTDVHPGVADTPVTALVARAVATAGVVQLLDIRGHSPPPSRFYSLRAPPLQTFF